MPELTKRRRCVPCEGKAKPLAHERVVKAMEEIPVWKLAEDEKSITREFNFNSFVEAMAFLDRLADLAEFEGHHPDIHLSYTNLILALTTHAINGLSENDFILASEIEDLI